MYQWYNREYGTIMTARVWCRAVRCGAGIVLVRRSRDHGGFYFATVSESNSQPISTFYRQSRGSFGMAKDDFLKTRGSFVHVRNRI